MAREMRGNAGNAHRGPRRQKRKPDAAVRARAEELHDAGMPFQMAMAVAYGNLDLNEALQRLAMKDQVTRLMERHELNRALATQVAMGHADLKQILTRRRLKQFREENRDRTCLVEGAELAIATTDGRTLTGTVGEVSAYTFRFSSGDDGDEELHKLQAKFSYPPQLWKKVRKAVRIDKQVAGRATVPAERPQDRYSCSDKRMFSYVDGGDDVQATLVTGDLIRGQVTWFSRFEFGMQVKGAEITVFRHALQDLRPAA